MVGAQRAGGRGRLLPEPIAAQPGLFQSSPSLQVCWLQRPCGLLGCPLLTQPLPIAIGMALPENTVRSAQRRACPSSRHIGAGPSARPARSRRVAARSTTQRRTTSSRCADWGASSMRAATSRSSAAAGPRRPLHPAAVRGCRRCRPAACVQPVPPLRQTRPPRYRLRHARSPAVAGRGRAVQESSSVRRRSAPSWTECRPCQPPARAHPKACTNAPPPHRTATRRVCSARLPVPHPPTRCLNTRACHHTVHRRRRCAGCWLGLLRPTPPAAALSNHRRVQLGNDRQGVVMRFQHLGRPGRGPLPPRRQRPPTLQRVATSGQRQCGLLGENLARAVEQRRRQRHILHGRSAMKIGHERRRPAVTSLSLAVWRPHEYPAQCSSRAHRWRCSLARTHWRSPTARQHHQAKRRQQYEPHSAGAAGATLTRPSRFGSPRHPAQQHPGAASSTLCTCCSAGLMRRRPSALTVSR